MRATAHNARMHILLTFMGFAVAAWALWKLLRRQEEADPDFERTLQADERRARSNRESAARASRARDEAMRSQQGDGKPPSGPLPGS